MTTFLPGGGTVGQGDGHPAAESVGPPGGEDDAPLPACHSGRTSRASGAARPEEGLRRFLLLLVEHAAVGKGMAVAPASIMATDSPVFDDARAEMAACLDRLLSAGSAAGTIRSDVDGRTLLRALGGVAGSRGVTGRPAGR